MQVNVYLLERRCGRELQGKRTHSWMDFLAIIESHRWGFPGVTKYNENKTYGQENVKNFLAVVIVHAIVLGNSFNKRIHIWLV